MQKLVTISDLSKSLNLIDPKNKKPLNYILRYWEKEFKQIKHKIINKRRYYSYNQVKIVKFIHFLLKNKGITEPLDPITFPYLTTEKHVSELLE